MEVVRTFLTVVRSRSRGRPVPVELVASGLEQAPFHSRASPRSLIVLPDSFDTPCLTPAAPVPDSFDTSSLPSMRNTVAVEAAYEGGSNLPLIVSGAGGVTGRAGLKIDAKILHGQGAGSQTGRASMKAGPYRRAGAGARKGASHRAAAGRLGHQVACAWRAAAARPCLRIVLWTVGGAGARRR